MIIFYEWIGEKKGEDNEVGQLYFVNCTLPFDNLLDF